MILLHHRCLLREKKTYQYQLAWRVRFCLCVLACRQALHLSAAKQATRESNTPHTQISSCMLLLCDFSWLPQMETLLEGYLCISLKPLLKWEINPKFSSQSLIGRREKPGKEVGSLYTRKLRTLGNFWWKKAWRSIWRRSLVQRKTSKSILGHRRSIFMF